MSPHTLGSRSATTPLHPTDHGRILVDSTALQGFSSAHRSTSAIVGDQVRDDEAAIVDLAITFGLIGAEFLAAVVEFLRLHRENLSSTARRQERLADTTQRADADHCDCDRAAAKELSL
ncbi:type VII secretion target [Gordonia aurantiaca]|uniref:type VII secretion target n=1 Tax=Gordonia sp. B21 TaxID=3151852 RepID=UPI003263FA37